jgi:hypothetical protein
MWAKSASESDVAACGVFFSVFADTSAAAAFTDLAAAAIAAGFTVGKLDSTLSIAATVYGPG